MITSDGKRFHFDIDLGKNAYLRYGSYGSYRNLVMYEMTTSERNVSVFVRPVGSLQGAAICRNGN